MLDFVLYVVLVRPNCTASNVGIQFLVEILVYSIGTQLAILVLFQYSIEIFANSSFEQVSIPPSNIANKPENVFDFIIFIQRQFQVYLYSFLSQLLLYHLLEFLAFIKFLKSQNHHQRRLQQFQFAPLLDSDDRMTLKHLFLLLSYLIKSFK